MSERSYAVPVPRAARVTVPVPQQPSARTAFHDSPSIPTLVEPLDWSAVHAEARALLDQTASDAEAIVTDARGRAQEVIAAALEAASEIERAAKSAAHDEGLAAGRLAAQTEMDEMLETMRGLVEMARVERHKIIETAEPEIVKLSMAIAERILHQQIALDRGVVIEMTKAALARLVDRETVTVRVNPSDIERIREHRDELLALGDVKHMRVVEDQRVDRGGVVLETEAGAIDAKISTQLAEARRVLHVDDDVTTVPAGQISPADSSVRAS